MLGAAQRVCGVPLRAIVKFPSLLMAEPGTPGGSVLKDVVAYVEVWSANGTENYSKTFTNQLVEMGAKVSKTFNKQVTHVVFKDGYQRTWDKAQARGVKLVSVLWVEQCRTAGVRADEALFPAARPPEHLPCLVRRKHKCMQPKDFTPKTPENDKRLQKKFEKMANELQRQRTTLDDDVPVLLFESSGSLRYSPTAAVQRGRRLAMEKRLQEMKEKRENLSLTSSQLTEKSYDGSACEAAPSASRDAVCSDDPFAGGQRLSPSELCGDAGCGHQDRRQGRPAGGTQSAACLSAPDLETRNTHPPASPQRRSLWTPRNPPRPVPEEEGGGQGDPAGGAVTPDVGSPARVLNMWGEKCSPSPAPPAPAGRLVGRPGPGGFSAKRGRGSQCGDSPPEGSLKRRKCGRDPPAPGVRLFEDEPPDRAASPYEDYFSPENLRERSAETRPPGRWSPSSPAWLRGAAGLSKRQRRSVLETADFSCLGRSLTSPDLASSTPKTSARLRGPPGVQLDSPLGHVAPETPPAAEEAPGRPRQGEAEAETREGAAPEGSRRPCADPELEGPPVRPGDTAPTNGGDGGAKGSVGVFAGVRKEERPPRAPRPPEGEDGPARRGDSGGSLADHKDRRGPHEASKRRGKGQKPTRTLVMTSLPPEERNVVVQVVAKLKGFSVAREVCGSTTHVLAGRALRTLNVLLGLARGCWILSYEWICRRERHSSAGLYQGTLFAGQPPMFISPASDPPRAKLWELVRLCGGQVTRVPRQATISIGPCHGRKTGTGMHLSEKWILDSITQHKVCACENYLLQ